MIIQISVVMIIIIVITTTELLKNKIKNAGTDKSVTLATYRHTNRPLKKKTKRTENRQRQTNKQTNKGQTSRVDTNPCM